jgi:hypothetical protein
MDKQIKETLIHKIQNTLEKSSDNERISIKDFSSISSKKAGNLMIFYHPAYNNVYQKLIIKIPTFIY